MGYKFSSADLLVVLALGIAWTRRDEILRNYRARGDKSPLDPLAPVKPFASSTSDALLAELDTVLELDLTEWKPLEPRKGSWYSMSKKVIEGVNCSAKFTQGVGSPLLRCDITTTASVEAAWSWMVDAENAKLYNPADETVSYVTERELPSRLLTWKTRFPFPITTPRDIVVHEVQDAKRRRMVQKSVTDERAPPAAGSLRMARLLWGLAVSEIKTDAGGSASRIDLALQFDAAGAFSWELIGPALYEFYAKELPEVGGRIKTELERTCDSVREQHMMSAIRAGG